VSSSLAAAPLSLGKLDRYLAAPARSTSVMDDVAPAAAAPPATAPPAPAPAVASLVEVLIDDCFDARTTGTGGLHQQIYSSDTLTVSFKAYPGVSRRHGKLGTEVGTSSR
jgi:hypothetical protein